MSCGEGCPRTKAVPHGPQTATGCVPVVFGHPFELPNSNPFSTLSTTFNSQWERRLVSSSNAKPVLYIPNCFELIAICACSLGNDNHALNVI